MIWAKYICCIICSSNCLSFYVIMSHQPVTIAPPNTHIFNFIVKILSAINISWIYSIMSINGSLNIFHFFWFIVNLDSILAVIYFTWVCFEWKNAFTRVYDESFKRVYLLVHSNLLGYQDNSLIHKLGHHLYIHHFHHSHLHQLHKVHQVCKNLHLLH